MQEAVGGGWEWGRNSGKGNPAMKCVEEGVLLSQQLSVPGKQCKMHALE